MHTQHPTVEALLWPADRLRARLYRLLGPWLAPYVRDRELRTAALGVLGVTTALVLSAAAPLWLLAFGPIVLGVPHVLADIRYLWVQPGFHRERKVWLLVVPCLLMGAFSAAVSWGIAAALLALFALPSTRTRRIIGVAVLLPLLIASIRWSGPSMLIYAHGHNVLAVALWLAMWRRGARWHWLVLATIAAASALLLLGGADAWLSSRDALSGRSMAFAARSLAPWAETSWALRIVVLYVLWQSIHYLIWLRLMPEEARERPSPRPFASSYHALKRELGGWLLGGAALSALALALWALIDLWAARDGYLRAAIFHGHLEIAAAALLWARGGATRRGA